MTTIITIVVVALVFFVTVCIIAFMVWKREAEMRTDSIKAIESNLEEMLYELTGSHSGEIRRRMRQEEELRTQAREPRPETKQETTDKPETDRLEPEPHKEPQRKKNHDPFEWVRAESDSEKDIGRAGGVTAETSDENITIFEPAAVQYTSFERGGDPSERDGKRGLKWKEVEEPRQEADSPKEELQSPQSVEVPVPEPEEAMRPEPPSPEPPTPEPPSPEPQVLQQPQPEAAPQPELSELLFTDPQPQMIEEPQPQPLIWQEEPVPAPPSPEEKEDREAEEGGPLARLFKRHKKDRQHQEQGSAPSHEWEAEQEQQMPVQETYETIEDLLKDYISEPHSESEYEEEYEAGSETYYFEPVRPGYDVGKSGRRYTAAELEALIKE